VDAFGEIGVFVRVVEKRSFSRAAETMGLTASGVSRAIGRLEARLGVRLIERTTRSLGLTADGSAYYDRCIRILRELEDADSAIAVSRGVPRGRLRVDAPTVLGRFVLGPVIDRLLESHPELAIDLSIRDHVIDPIAEGVDVVLRMAPLRESELVAKKLGTLRLLVVGAPSYFLRKGRPKHPQDLREHEMVGFIAGSLTLPWKLRVQQREVAFAPNGRLNTNSFDAIKQAVLAGHGLAQVFEAHVRDELARRTLEPVLGDHERIPVEVHALCTRDRAAQPKVRVFLEAAAAELRARRGRR
jgi:DNA-binding transcriptional LysR family regulator